MAIIHHTNEQVPFIPICSANCGIVSALHCHIGEWRRLRDDLSVAQRAKSPDAEVLRGDVRAIEARINHLFALSLAQQVVA